MIFFLYLNRNSYFLLENCVSKVVVFCLNRQNIVFFFKELTPLFPTFFFKTNSYFLYNDQNHLNTIFSCNLACIIYSLADRKENLTYKQTKIWGKAQKERNCDIWQELFWIPDNNSKTFKFMLQLQFFFCLFLLSLNSH